MEFVDQLAGICQDIANVWFDGLKPAPQDTLPTPFWGLDRRAFEAELGSDLARRPPHRVANVASQVYEVMNLASRYLT
jgi:hypothetical protein